MMNWTGRWTARVCGVLLVLAPLAGSRAQADEEPEPVPEVPVESVEFDEKAGADGVFAPPLNFYNWQCMQRSGWWLEQGPRWISLGHLARLIGFLPEADGAGNVHTVHLDVRKILAFAEDGTTPAATRLLERLSIRADDPERLKTRRRWGFPSEEPYNWEMEKVPFREHQALERLFLHDDDQVWQTLMIHSEAALREVDGATFFAEFMCHILIFELLHDERIPMTSTYPDRYPPSIVDWIARREVKAPWALGKKRLVPTGGAASFAPADEPSFQAGHPVVWHGFPERFSGRPQLPASAKEEPQRALELERLFEDTEADDLLP